MRPPLEIRLRQLWEQLVPPDLWADPELMRQAGRLVAFDLAMLFWVVIFAPIYYVLGGHSCSVVLLAVGLVLASTLLFVRRGQSPTVCGNLLCCAGWCTYTSLVMLTGGMNAPSPVLTWFASMPICAVYMCGIRSGFLWTAASLVTISVLAAADGFGLHTNELSPFGMQLIQYLSLVGLVTCIFVLVFVLTRFEQNARRILHEANCRLEMQSSLDSLTGIANRRAFDWTLQREWSRHERAQAPLSVALIDVDWFKQYNDRLGHLAGDEVLRAIAMAIGTGVHRPADFVARFGGEEFSVVLPNTDEAQAMHVMEVVHERVRAMQILFPDPQVSPHVTISIGIATTIPGWNESCTDLVHDADMALYRAKAQGRDQAVHAARFLAAAGGEDRSLREGPPANAATF